MPTSHYQSALDECIGDNALIDDLCPLPLGGFRAELCFVRRSNLFLGEVAVAEAAVA